MLIPGYEGGPLIDGSDFLSELLFWPNHLGSCLRGEESQALAFGPDWDAAKDVYRRVSDGERWPVFSVHLLAGPVIHVVYRNLDDDIGVDYLVHHPEWGDAVPVAVDDGHFMGPGLSWRELVAVADQPVSGGVADADARLLLLFPMLGDADVPEAAAARLASALSTLTVVEEPAELAVLLLRNQGQWEQANWRQGNGVWVCDGRHSCRNPSSGFALPAPRMAQISNALNSPFGVG
ncbi:hypothetical protein [Actinophytocola glycyrrhizae]|uniref:Uncharacterized protein n=1 Tax=Actinophytocola glycyrrhizae TaxID=2044873 RepID=A0ABV9RZB6_9PSEU